MRRECALRAEKRYRRKLRDNFDGSQCTRCYQYPHREGKKTCQVCADRSHEHHLRHAESDKKRSDDWWKAHPVKRERRRIRRLLRYHGITVEKYHELYERQGGKCAICRETWPPLDLSPKNGNLRTRLSVDHDHITNTVRGLLCPECNTGLGMFKDSAFRLEKAAEYILCFADQKAAPMVQAATDAKAQQEGQ